MVMKTYKIGFSSDVYETVEVEAKNTNDAKEKFHKGEIDFSEAIRESLELTGFRMTDSKNQVVCDIWLRKELPVNPKFRPTLDTNYGFARSQLIGAMRVPENGTKDLRDQRLKAGSYTLRYAQQPMDGNHIGSWPYLDFAVTLSAQQDKKPENRGEQEVVDASMSGRVHPAIFSLMPPEKRKTLPAVVHQSSGNLWILALPAEIKSILLFSTKRGGREFTILSLAFSTILFLEPSLEGRSKRTTGIPALAT